MAIKHFLYVTLVAKPFDSRPMRMLASKTQKDLFLSLTKLYTTGFDEEWDKNYFEDEFDTEKKTELRFYGEKTWLEEQKQKIEVEMFEVLKESKFSAMREKVKRMMPFKKRVSKEEFDANSKYDKFVTGLALFNITVLMGIDSEAE